MGKRKGGYVRASDGKFSKTAGTKAQKKTKSVKNKATSVGSKTLRARLTKKRKSKLTGPARKFVGKVGQGAVRKARNQAGLDSLRKKGVSIPKGSIAKVKGLRKGQSVKLSNGTVIRRTSNNGYTATKPKKKKGKK